MTTFKNNAKYAELLLTYLDVAYRGDTPLTIQEVLAKFSWRFKGGSLRDASESTRLKPETSDDSFPNGTTGEILAQWPHGREAMSLRRLLHQRAMQGRLRSRGVLARLGTYLLLTSSFGNHVYGLQIYSGMKSIYFHFAKIWEWAAREKPGEMWENLHLFTRELLHGSAVVSRAHVPTVEENRKQYVNLLLGSRVPGLLKAVLQLKELIRMANGPDARRLARSTGLAERDLWGEETAPEYMKSRKLSDLGACAMFLRQEVGPSTLLVTQGCSLFGTGEMRFALSKSDMERLHQLTMAAASAIVGVVAQSVSGTLRQRSKAKMAVQVAQANIDRIVVASGLVPLGDEVLVCKGYRRAYTAHLGWLAGGLCLEETKVLVQEATETAAPGVLDVVGFLSDLRSLDAASSLNAAKMFKICPAPDVSPGLAMIDRIRQVGDGNTVDPDMMPLFESELKTQILRAYIRSSDTRLKPREGVARPLWFTEYLQGKYEAVPSDEIDKHLAWEATATMPDVSPYDPSHWKDSGLGADDRFTAMNRTFLGHKANMITRLIFDDECPMPGSERLNSEHVIKFFVKAEGHKDPARGIFSSNLRDRQAQSWMEKAVETVAKHHPSYMIGQEVQVKEARIMQLTTRPCMYGWVALYYSFDISGWSAKMPAEPQRISHRLWAKLFGGHLFNRATEINEGAFIYLNMDGYMGWFRNTHANLEGFNGKEMTMVLIALLSLSVRRWRARVVEEGIMTEEAAERTSALLFAYIDDGLSRIDLPIKCAVAAFSLYKEVVIDTFSRCGFSVEVSKCFPSDRFSIFLNEVYIAGRHVVHGVRAAMGISAEPTERHTSLVERCTTVATGCRGAVMAGLDPQGAVLLMAYHTYLHLVEWVTERDPVILAAWCLTPRSWGGLGMPNMLQLFVSGSGAAFEEGVATLQAYSRINRAVKKLYMALCRGSLMERTAVGILTAPLSGRVKDGYMVDSRVSVAVRKALTREMEEGRLSRYAMRLLRYADIENLAAYADAVIPLGEKEVLQEQMLDNVSEAHPHCIFSSFARRLEKSMTVLSVVGRDLFSDLMSNNREEAKASIGVIRTRMLY